MHQFSLLVSIDGAWSTMDLVSGVDRRTIHGSHLQVADSVLYFFEMICRALRVSLKLNLRFILWLLCVVYISHASVTFCYAYTAY